MAYTNLKQEIDNYVYENHENEILGKNLQKVLKDMVDVLGDGYRFMGVARTNTTIPAPEEQVFYLVGNGEYGNFGSTKTVPLGFIGVMYYDTQWNMSLINLNLNALNLNYYEGGSAIFSNRGLARQSVPNDLRHKGLIISYVANGIQYCELCISSASATWGDDASWFQIYPFNSASIAHNSQTGYEDLTINGQTTPLVGTQRETALHNQLSQEIQNAVAGIEPIVIEGNVTNAPDEEDLTSVDQGGTDVLKFKDKAYDSLTASGLGRKYLRKNIVNGVNTLTQAMINEANTIYHVQYDYTLVENITIPANCVLMFEGGSISNGNTIYTLTGNKTRIVSPLSQIFNPNIKFGGTWDIEQWEADWFGAIADGTITISEGHLATFGGTDNFDAIQSALYAASLTNMPIVHLSQGGFRISKPLYLGYNSYNNLSLFGSGKVYVPEGSEGATKGTALYCDNDMAGILVNSGRGNVIKDLALFGKNTYYNNHYNAETVSDAEDFWYGAAIEKHNGLTFAGIAIDALKGNTNFTPYESKYGMNINITAFSSRVAILNVAILGFYSCIDLQPIYDKGNCDFITIKDNVLLYAVFGIRNFAYQNRNFDLENTTIEHVHTAITNRDTEHVGWAGQMQGNIRHLSIGMAYRIFDLTDFTPTFLDCYGESFYYLGKFSWSGNVSPIAFIGCKFSFLQGNNNPNVGTIMLLDTNATFQPVILLINTILQCSASGFYPLIMPNVMRIGYKESINADKIVSVNMCINGQFMYPQFEINRKATINGIYATITVSNTNFKVGDYVLINTGNCVLQVTEIDSTTVTMKALNGIKGGAIISTVIDPNEAYNWYKIPAPFPNEAEGTGETISHVYPADKYNTRGQFFYNINQNKPAWWNGAAWIAADGFTIGLKSGSQNQRPKGIGASGGILDPVRDRGYMFFDLDLGKPIYAKIIANDGTVTWVDATGTTI